jgi:hypothetical protein
MLPPAHGAVPITLAGPVGSLSITAPRGTPVQLRTLGSKKPRSKARKRYVVTARRAVTTIRTGRD